MRSRGWQFRICVCLLVLNLLFIWGNSALPGESSRVVSRSAMDLDIGFFLMIGEKMLRKVAHFAEFGSLGLLLGWFFRLLGRQRRAFADALAAGLLAALLDETIQYFVPGRSSSIMDVWLDFSGVCTGVVLLILGYSIFRKWKRT